MRVTETKGLVMAFLALDEKEMEEFAEAPAETIVERVKNELTSTLGEKVIREVLVSYDRGPKLIAAVKI